mmetsp:Transcript_41893/g.84621  ORF Transcript_41893/g.84621 Transcript_41893/m.84621 type:complete len:80 (+) Transcript_41893:1481-1720(+)
MPGNASDFVNRLCVIEHDVCTEAGIYEKKGFSGYVASVYFDDVVQKYMFRVIYDEKGDDGKDEVEDLTWNQLHPFMVSL